MKLFKKLFSTLNRKNLRYLIAGGVAVNLYGIERSTADLDLVVKSEGENLQRFVDAAKELGLRPKMPVKLEDFVDPDKRREWVREKGMMVFSLYDPKNPFFLLDLFVEEPFDFDTVYRNRKIIHFEDVEISVVPIKELIRMKEKSNRPQDQADIFYLKKIAGEWKNEK